MAASHPVARLAAASFHLPVNPNTGARVAHYERAAPLNAAAAALEDKDDDQVVRPERAAVMQGQDSGRVWVRAGGVALAAPRLVAGGKLSTTCRSSLLVILGHFLLVPPRKILKTETLEGLNFHRRAYCKNFLESIYVTSFLESANYRILFPTV